MKTIPFSQLPKIEEYKVTEGRAMKTKSGSIIQVGKMPDGYHIDLRKPINEKEESQLSFGLTHDAARALYLLIGRIIRTEIK